VIIFVIVFFNWLGPEGSDMRPPDIAAAIVADVFIGRPEGVPAIGSIEHRRAVVWYNVEQMSVISEQ